MELSITPNNSHRVFVQSCRTILPNSQPDENQRQHNHIIRRINLLKHFENVATEKAEEEPGQSGKNSDFTSSEKELSNGNANIEPITLIENETDLAEIEASESVKKEILENNVNQVENDNNLSKDNVITIIDENDDELLSQINASESSEEGQQEIPEAEDNAIIPPDLISANTILPSPISRINQAQVNSFDGKLILSPSEDDCSTCSSNSTVLHSTKLNPNLESQNERFTTCSSSVEEIFHSPGVSSSNAVIKNGDKSCGKRGKGKRSPLVSDENASAVEVDNSGSLTGSKVPSPLPLVAAASSSHSGRRTTKQPKPIVKTSKSKFNRVVGVSKKRKKFEIRPKSFEKIVREIYSGLKAQPPSFSPRFMPCLQEASEQYCISMFQKLELCTAHRNTVTVTVDDLNLIKSIRHRQHPHKE